MSKRESTKSHPVSQEVPITSTSVNMVNLSDNVILNHDMLLKVTIFNEAFFMIFGDLITKNVSKNMVTFGDMS